MAKLPWFDESGELIRKIPTECVSDCSHSGDCEIDCTYWVKKLNFIIPRDKTIAYLKEFGAWTLEDLNSKNDEELAIITLWVACNDIAEQGEWLGLVH